MQIEGITGEPFVTDEYDATPIPRRIEIQGQPVLLECEQALWIALEKTAAKEGLSLSTICGDLLQTMHADNTFAEAARIYVIGSFIQQNLEILPPDVRAQVENLYKYGVN